jgi:hypothetical protein
MKINRLEKDLFNKMQHSMRTGFFVQGKTRCSNSLFAMKNDFFDFQPSFL